LREFPYTIDRLGQLDRAGFSCGSASLDHYFERQVSQDIRRRITACYVAVCNASHQVAGFYTLSTTQISVMQLPDRFKNNLPRYPSVPAVRIGRLAIDMKFQGQGLGSTLLINAIYRRSIRADIAAYAVIVDAKDDAAIAFYRHHGFWDLNVQERTLFVPLAQFAKAFLCLMLDPIRITSANLDKASSSL
jgi:ribosomal protein S18 acetylase RimI-like enzyme